MLKSLSREGRKLLKDVSLGVITTVIGATLIYFLGFYNKKNPLTKLEREEIAVNAWRSYITIENINIEASASLMREALQTRDFPEVAVEAAATSQKFHTSLEDLVKAEGLDKHFVDFLKKRLQSEKLQSEESGKFYKGLESGDISWINAPQETLREHVAKFARETNDRVVALAPLIQNTASELSKKYTQPFNINELLVIQSAKYRKNIFNLEAEKKEDAYLPPEGSGTGNPGIIGVDAGVPAKLSKQYLATTWKTGNATITLRADGKMSWLIQGNSVEAKGTWLLKNNQLVMNIPQHPVSGKRAKWVFHVSDVMTRSFSIKLDTIPYKTYILSHN